jgi:UDP-GlcNAc:undecaprenyl-phosphate/decaprenyl-phosphate GlcNAc-1-phosphate transferase
MNSMVYLFIIVVLIISELLYFKVANYFNIIDKPNSRSSHIDITIRGGGIVFWLSSIIYFVYSGCEYTYFFIGLTIVSIVSFLDDIFTLSNKYRLIIQFIAIGLMLWQLNLNTPIWLFIGLLIACVGILNAYNFMDGINGITGGYSLVNLISLLFVNNYFTKFIENEFIIFIILGVVVFNFFNFRKRAKCFAGDIGSVSIAFIIIFLLIKLVLQTNQYIYILFLSLYGIDTVFTLVVRIWLKENIFKAHNKHFFQLLVNKSGFSHLQVSILYSIVQLFINLFVIFVVVSMGNVLLNSMVILITFSFIYVYLRLRTIKSQITIK